MHCWTHILILEGLMNSFLGLPLRKLVRLLSNVAGNETPAGSVQTTRLSKELEKLPHEHGAYSCSLPNLAANLSRGRSMFGFWFTTSIVIDGLHCPDRQDEGSCAVKATVWRAVLLRLHASGRSEFVEWMHERMNSLCPSCLDLRDSNTPL
jgi:hypothetical protein